MDLSLTELRRTLSIAAQDDYRHVKCQGLHGTYDDGLAWLKRPENLRKPSWVLFLGSSMGNFTHAEAAAFLKGFSDVLGSNDSMIIGLDACQDKDKVYRAYHDKAGKTREFYLNGLAHANALLGKKVFEPGKWDIVGEYDEAAGRHQAFYVPTTDTVVDGVCVKAGEKILFEKAYKYPRLQSMELWRKSGFVPGEVFGNSTDDYRKLDLQPCSVMTKSLREKPWSRDCIFQDREAVCSLSPALKCRCINLPSLPSYSLISFRCNWENSSLDWALTFTRRMQIYTCYLYRLSRSLSTRSATLLSLFRPCMNFNSYGQHGIQ